MSAEEPGSGGIRAARGLRQAPPQRTPFNPDTGPAFRHSRPSFNNASPQPHTPNAGGSHSMNSSSNPNSAYFVASNYEPRPQVPISTREVITPGNRPILFAKHRERRRALIDTQDPLRYLEVAASPGIYMRCLHGIRSGIPSEMDFALHHLVKISFERGDKYKFEGFPLLAESLIEKALEVTLLAAGKRWEVDYNSKVPSKKDNVLNGTFGTPDILSRLKKFPIIAPNDSLEDPAFSHRLLKINESVSILRNMIMLKENATFLANMPLFRDFLSVGLNVPNQPRFNEIKNNALDMAEQATRYWTTGRDDPVFISLLNCLDSPDRYHNLAALRAVNCFSMELEESNRLQSVPLSKIRILMNWTLLELDRELLGATLDFLYQYTALPENVEELLKHFQIQTTLVPRLTNLLLFDSVHVQNTHVDQEEKRGPAPNDIPPIPPDLFIELLKLAEPERSSRWLRSCFVEDDECEITQIALWQAYQSRFADSRVAGGSILPAAEFIKNVSSTFSRAQAQVINGPPPKFIIKGIRPLEVAYTLDGYPYLCCKWTDPSKPTKPCKNMYPTPTKLRDHVFGEHLKLETDSSGSWDLSKSSSSVVTCHWNKCNRFSQGGMTEDVRVVSGHVKSHLPAERDDTQPPPVPGRDILQHRICHTTEFFDTPVDEKGEAVGIAYTAVLIMRNIIRNLPKELSGPEHGNKSWNNVIFFSHRRKILETMDLNRSLRKHICDVANRID
ncbi:Chromatin structure-remodeling complex protein rsc9 [Arachnomyces sp. PD_36]|nr:Chromatin structure-remodeling complex protein rsc9 [Arachnomyces sp. PD_36]